MLRSLWKLTWIEMKIFAREPLGLFGTLAMPVLLFVILGRVLGGRAASRPPEFSRIVGVDLPIFAALLVSTGAVLSLVTIISIYREGGILRRLRATPLRPETILTAHVLAKLVFTSATLIVLALAGRRFVPEGQAIPFVRFGGGAALHDRLPAVDWLRDRERRADGAIRAADRDARPLSDDGGIRAVRADRRAAGRRPDGGAPAAIHARRLAASRRMAARPVVRSPRRHRRAAAHLRRLHRAVGEDFPMGVGAKSRDR